MDVHPHVDALKSKHRALDARIEDLSRSPGVDDLELKRLKAEKLHLKEEIARHEQALGDPGQPGGRGEVR